MKNYLGLIFLLFAFTATAQNNRSALLPMPNHIEQVQWKPFSLTGNSPRTTGIKVCGYYSAKYTERPHASRHSPFRLSPIPHPVNY